MRKLLLIIGMAAMIGLAGCGSEAPTPAAEATTEAAYVSEEQQKINNAIANSEYASDIFEKTIVLMLDGAFHGYGIVNDPVNFSFACLFMTSYAKDEYPDSPANITIRYENGDEFLDWHTTDLEKGFFSAPGISAPNITVDDLIKYGPGLADVAAGAATEATTEPEPEATTEATTEPEPEETTEAEPEATTGQLNALDKAKDYLSFTAFSKKGLRSQLEYEGFKDDEIDYAIENCGADWKEQAVKKAKEYLEFSSFSKENLIEQLEYEGFTEKQAKYGADEAYK